MPVRIGLTVAGVFVAILAVYLVISAVIGMVMWVAIFGVLTAVAVVAIKVTRRSGRAIADRTSSMPKSRVKGAVDCAGQALNVGDAVRTSGQFDGPIELALSHGTIVKLTHGKAHVRFDDAPDQVHTVKPTVLRRIG